MVQLVALAFLFALGVICIREVGFARTSFGLLVLSLAVAPKVLHTDARGVYVGLAPGGSTVYTFTVAAIISGLVALALAGPHVLRAGKPWVPFIGLGIVFNVFFWIQDPLTVSGDLQVSTAIVCFVAASALIASGAVPFADLARICYAVVAVEAATAVLDLAGHPVYSAHGPQAADLAGRVIGTTDHPDQLAKLMLLVVAVLLAHNPLSRGEYRLHRACIVGAVGVVALTEGRAAFAGAVVAVVLWFLLEPDRSLRRRHAAGVAGTAGVLVAGGSAVIARFHTDPYGDVRSQLASLAYRVIGAHRWAGIGINHYVAVVGRIDQLTATGVPVHNAFLLTIAEMGLLCGLAFWLPFGTLILSAIRVMRDNGPRGAAGRAYLALMPAFILTSITGWGILQPPSLELLGIVVGSLGGALAATHLSTSTVGVYARSAALT